MTFPHSALRKPIFIRRWLSFSLASLAAYVLLDRSTVYLQLWHSISAWYPPAGLEFALFLGLGEVAFPAMFLAGFVAGILNYHQSPTSLEFLFINPLIPTLYYIASHFVRRRLDPDLRLHSMRDVLNLLGFSLTAACVSASTGTTLLSATGDVPAGDFVQAAFNWWIGDAVALAGVSIFLLEFVIPGLRRFLGLAPAISTFDPDAASHLTRKTVLEALAFCAALFFTLDLSGC